MQVADENLSLVNGLIKAEDGETIGYSLFIVIFKEFPILVLDKLDSPSGKNTFYTIQNRLAIIPGLMEFLEEKYVSEQIFAGVDHVKNELFPLIKEFFEDKEDDCLEQFFDQKKADGSYQTVVAN